MACDVMILNTAATDLRRDDFDFAGELAGPGGLALCKNEDMPSYTQEQIKEWIDAGHATAGGPGNTAPLIARAGLDVAVGVNLGKGPFDGLDATGSFFHKVLTDNNVDMSAIYIHPTLPTGTTFIHDVAGEDRGGLVYFPNANSDFDLQRFKPAIEKLAPKIVYYMYSGLSERGDANGGRDLADFIKWCSDKGIVTIVDSHTLTSDPKELIASGAAVEEYRLLEPLLPVVDIFFTSSDESKMIENTLSPGREWLDYPEEQNNIHFLDFLADRFWQRLGKTQLIGVTVSDGAYEKHLSPDGNASRAQKTTSNFMAGGTIDLVGAGDSFRAGLISFIGSNLDEFRNGTMDFAEAVQMGNLFASLYIKAPLDDRYGNIRSFDKLLKIVRSGHQYDDFGELQNDL